MNRRVYLVGFMGAGKSSVGPLVAAQLGWVFVDLDSEIESREARSIVKIFEESGEQYFRALEGKYLRLISAKDQRVISLGGGAYNLASNRTFVEKQGLSIYLAASLEKIQERISFDGTRPLFVGADQIDELFKLREHSYAMAKICIDTNALSVEEVAEEVVKAVRDSWVSYPKHD